ncbi:hypothetical protein [Burkholderia multivorans]|uniref:hypothetical protein n=1 Tax=Burkholderia multivorans TaxID=87883 RepID=UPI002870461C|nr:hypothetical protein [Burkholderia multivorans]
MATSFPCGLRDSPRLIGKTPAEHHLLSSYEHATNHHHMLPNTGVFPPALAHVLTVVAYSGERDHAFRRIVIMDSE